MKETSFQKHLLDGLRAMGCKAFKISDRAIGERKPFDIHACVKGRYWAIECKFTHCLHFDGSSVVVTEKDLQNHQPGELAEITKSGGVGYFAVAIYHETDYRQRKAWLVAESIFGTRNRWSIDDLDSHPNIIKLAWSSVATGWTINRATA